MQLAQDSIINLNKSRQRAIYWRLVGDKWVQTNLLPADPLSINLYLGKGFKAKNPETEQPVVVASKVMDNGMLHCPLCEVEAKGALGLQSHLRKHINKEVKV